MPSPTIARIVAAFFVAANAVDAQSPQPASSRPHVVVIVSDDAGYADFSMHGATDVATPRIDSIAKDGVRCAQGYVSGMVCSPTRAGLLTGRYQQRFGHEFNFAAAIDSRAGLPTDERTLADDLRAAGYRTAAIGKWHLGYRPEFHPTKRGFDDCYMFLQGARPYLPLPEPNAMQQLQRGTDAAKEDFDYLTDALAADAVRRIEQRGDAPLFLYIAFNAVHAPMQALPADEQGAEGKPRRRKLIAMTRALDRGVGRVLDALAQAGIADDTLLFFLNDNGGATNNGSSNGALRGHKGQPFEGGVRVPFLVRWPARLPKGRVFDAPVVALDVLPTCLAAAGTPAAKDRPLDGVDLLPYLRGERAERPHRALHWRQGADWAMRRDDLKLVHAGKAPPMLFDLAVDPGETTDLAADRPDDVKRLQAAHDAWAAQLATPRWRSGAGAAKDEDGGPVDEGKLR